MEALHRYAKNLGLAFQITDDLLDATGSPQTTGKDCGLDQRKTTFVAFAGLEGARRLADELRLDPSAEGVVVLDVVNGSPAQTFGFQKGDIVLSVNSQQIGKTRDLERATAQSSRVWRITIRRGGQQMSVVLSG